MKNTILKPPILENTGGIAVEECISREKFYEHFVTKDRPVVMKGLMDKWRAKTMWNNQYFANLESDQEVVAKKGNVNKGNMQAMKLSEYVRMVQAYEHSGKKGAPPYYLHDFPLFQAMPELSKDIEPFPLELFPEWYSEHWWNYICFFMGSTNNYTPMHIDTLFTNNLFFQVDGYKEFTIILPKYLDKCYRHKWKWSKVDPDAPDYEQYPKFRDVEVIKFNVGPGDVLFMPAGTFHQVKSLSASISFNIDWHTKKTVLKGLGSFMKGASLPNIYYNALIASGLYLNIPPKYIFPLYKPYFSFIA